jgi:hypothetical protein
VKNLRVKVRAISKTIREKGDQRPVRKPVWRKTGVGKIVRSGKQSWRGINRAGVRARRMPKYLVRESCEYSLLVEAADEEEARSKAAEVHHSDWETAWSGVEVEADYSNGEE